MSQNLWVDGIPEHIVAIKSINDTSTANTTPFKKTSGISTGAIVGIVVAAVVILIFSAASAFFIIRRRRKKRKEPEKKDEDDDPYRKAEMDGSGKPPIGELYTEGKLGEVDSSSKVEMQGSQPAISTEDKQKLAEIEGSRGGTEMEGTAGGTEMEGSHLRAEMAGDHLAPVELDAGPLGLSELPSPNTSNSELPSPLSPDDNRRSRLSTAWTRRQKPTPRLPDSESSDLSADTEASARRSGASRQTARPRLAIAQQLDPTATSSSSRDSRVRRPSQPSLNPMLFTRPDSRHRRPSGPSQHTTGLDIPTRSTTPGDVSSQSSRSQERVPIRGTTPASRMQYASNRASPLGEPSSDGPSLRRAESTEEWNRTFGNGEGSAPRSPEFWSPVSPSDRSPSDAGWEMVGRRRPSPLGNNLSRSGTPRTGPSTEGVTREGSPLPPGNFF